MEIYLIRHTTPDIAADVCYGQTDLDIAESFRQEAEIIGKHLPDNIQHVISSPLQRCSKLAGFLFPHHSIEFNYDLKEINCGDWELKKWNDIPKDILDPWMREFVSSSFPNGESYELFYQRIINQFEAIVYSYNGSVAIVSHAGVLRSILSYITHTPLKDSFNSFKFSYGCVVKLNKQECGWGYTRMETI